MASNELDDDDAFEGDLDGDGGSFDDADSAFDDGIDDADEGSEGSFRENHDVFSTPSSAPEAHANPLTNKAQETAQYMTPQPSGLERAKRDGTLVAKWMSSNPADFRVAWFNGDKQAEAWRHPTRTEFEKFKNQGRFIKGGVKQAQQMKPGSMAGVDATDVPQSFLQKHKTKILVAGGVAAAAGGLYWLWRTYWAEANSEVQTTR